MWFVPQHVHICVIRNTTRTSTRSYVHWIMLALYDACIRHTTRTRIIRLTKHACVIVACMRYTTRSCMRYTLSICITCLVHTFYESCLRYMRVDSFMYLLICKACMRYTMRVCVTWLVNTFYESCLCNMTRTSTRLTNHECVIWFVNHVCVLRFVSVIYDSFVRLTNYACVIRVVHQLVLMLNETCMSYTIRTRSTNHVCVIRFIHAWIC